jgi:hypothetical protein
MPAILDHDSLIYATRIAGMAGVHRCDQLFISFLLAEMGSRELFAWLAWNYNPPDLSHWAQQIYRSLT